jgi:hypothetical protein
MADKEHWEGDRRRGALAVVARARDSGAERRRELASVGERAPEELHGWAFRISSLEDAVRAIEWAFDYRGDVTIELRSGERVVGYVFNRDASAKPPLLQMFLKGQAAPRSILFADVVGVTFSGPDTAAP